MEMFTYETLTASGVLPSNRYGTLEAIKARFGSNPDVTISDVPPVNVEENDFDRDWPGFARRGFKP